MVVTADPLSGDQADIAQPVSVLQRERMQTRDLRNIGEAVSQELGFLPVILVRRSVVR